MVFITKTPLFPFSPYAFKPALPSKLLYDSTSFCLITLTTYAETSLPSIINKIGGYLSFIVGVVTLILVLVRPFELLTSTDGTPPSKAN